MIQLPNCCEKFDSEDKLKNHELNKHTFSCGKCGEKFNTEDKVKYHEADSTLK